MCLLCAKSEHGGKHTSDEVKAGEAGAAPALATSTQQFGRGGGGGGGGGRGSGLGVRGWGPLSLRWCSNGGGDGRFGPMVLAGRSLQRAESWEMETRGETSHSVNQRGQAIQWFRSHCLNYAYSVIEIAPFRHYGGRVTFFPGYVPCSFHAPAFHEASWPSVGWKGGPYVASTSGEVSAVSGDVLPPHAS